MGKPDYIIKTGRLGLRSWYYPDLAVFTEMNCNPDVMRHFPKLMSVEETKNLYRRLLQHQAEFGYCFFAADILETGEFIGFVGLMNTRIESHFTPCIEIGWRLTPSAWGKGYATEGAKGCLKWAFENLDAEKIYAYKISRKRIVWYEANRGRTASSPGRARISRTRYIRQTPS